MTADDLRTLYWTEPFEPFELELTDGRRVAVARREWLAISPTGDTVVVAPTVLEMEIIDIPAIAGRGSFGPSARATANGAA